MRIVVAAFSVVILSMAFAGAAYVARTEAHLAAIQARLSRTAQDLDSARQHAAAVETQVKKRQAKRCEDAKHDHQQAQHFLRRVETDNIPDGPRRETLIASYRVEEARTNLTVARECQGSI